MYLREDLSTVVVANAVDAVVAEDDSAKAAIVECRQVTSVPHPHVSVGMPRASKVDHLRRVVEPRVVIRHERQEADGPSPADAEVKHRLASHLARELPRQLGFGGTEP